MKQSTIKWHLSRDNQVKLSKFCQENAVRHDNVEPYEVGDAKYFQHTYHFNNGGFVRAEMRAGDTKSYSVADHFQVVDYSLGV